MPLYRFKQFTPQIGDRCFIAPSADVIGRVDLGDNGSIWHGTVVRGDVAEIKIGENTNIQDLSILHVTDDIPLHVGCNVTVGHRVTLHSCTIGNNSLIGMGAIILDNVEVGENSLVAAGSLLPPGKVYPPYSFIIGSPAIVKRQLSEDEIAEYGNHYKLYLETKDDYLKERNQRID